MSEVKAIPKKELEAIIGTIDSAFKDDFDIAHAAVKALDKLEASYREAIKTIRQMIDEAQLDAETFERERVKTSLVHVLDNISMVGRDFLNEKSDE